MLGLHCCAGIFLVAASRSHSLMYTGFSRHWFLWGSTGSRVPAHQVHGFNSCSSQALRTGSTVVAHRLRFSMACETFPDQRLNTRLLHWQLDSLPLSQQGSLCCAVFSCPVVSGSLQPHGLEPTRLLCPRGFSRPEHWSGWPCPPPGDLLNPGIEHRSSVLQVNSLPSESPGKPMNTGVGSLSLLQGNLPDSGTELGSLALQVDSLPGLPGKPQGSLWMTYF